jgi:hypothetical protein
MVVTTWDRQPIHPESSVHFVDVSASKDWIPRLPPFDPYFCWRPPGQAATYSILLLDGMGLSDFIAKIRSDVSGQKYPHQNEKL